MSSFSKDTLLNVIDVLIKSTPVILNVYGYNFMPLKSILLKSPISSISLIVLEIITVESLGVVSISYLKASPEVVKVSV